ncbi:MAG: DUF4190 domain-containing protein [Actinomycetaceae bacterium]|nr:DUF4190 domain-containing protein [Actinomycetaceae bacterium]MDY5855277.1 DUF4190 domain-containing protein [Arcanobacterium sp.]
MSTPPAKSTSGLAIAALILGILAILGSWMPILNNVAIVLAVVGAILAIVGIVKLKKEANKGGKGLAIAGLVLSILAIVISLAFQSMYSKALDDALSSPKATSTTQPTDGTATSEKPAEKPAENPAAATNLAVGTKATLSNGLVVSVDAVEPAVKDVAGDSYMVATVSYTNTGTEKISYASFDWKGVGKNGAVNDAQFALLEDAKLLDAGSLNANGSVSGKVAFKADTVTIEYYSNALIDDEAAASWKAQ